MNERYLFRGKRKDGQGWIEGDLVHTRTTTQGVVTEIYTLDMSYEVDPETVGQCTGVKDKNGKMIYEGDIVYCKSRLDNANMVIIFECGQFRMVLSENYRSYQTNSGFYDINCFDKEVIGNIHDNSLEDFRSER